MHRHDSSGTVLPSLLGDVLDRERMSENISQNPCQRAFATVGEFRACLAMRRGDIAPYAARAVVAILCRNGVAIGLEGGPRIPPADAERIVHMGKVMR